jgi:uncharacterized glyoxalase superfamily protein PhnB
MPKIIATEAPRIFPTLRCRDADAMIRWLTEVLGFVEHAVHRADGAVVHAELAVGTSLVMLGQARDGDYDALVGDLRGRRTDAVYIAVDDADAIHARVVASGARIEMELTQTDYGSREFACRDPEGNLWSIGTYWPKVAPEPIP